MKTRLLAQVLTMLAALMLAGLSAPVLAQAYPSKPIKMIVPFAAGGITDVVTRLITDRMSQSLGQPIVVDNRAGAGGNIAMEHVARAPADGYTLMLALTPQMAVNGALYAKIPYDPLQSFAPISLIGEAPYLLLVHPGLPVNSLKDLLALAAQQKGQLAYASSGSGSGGHMAAELLIHMTGIPMTHVPYKGGGPALSDVLAGHVKVIFAPAASSQRQDSQSQAETPAPLREPTSEDVARWAGRREPVLLLDRIGNAHNLGALARTAAFFGVPHVAADVRYLVLRRAIRGPLLALIALGCALLFGIRALEATGRFGSLARLELGVADRRRADRGKDHRAAPETPGQRRQEIGRDAVGARIAQSHQAADDHRKRQGPHQVGGTPSHRRVDHVHGASVCGLLAQ